jgi:hypothetical protein
MLTVLSLLLTARSRAADAGRAHPQVVVEDGPRMCPGKDGSLLPPPEGRRANQYQTI